MFFLPIILMFLLSGCTFHSIKIEHPDDVEARLRDINCYLESLHANLKITAVTIKPVILSKKPDIVSQFEQTKSHDNEQLIQNLATHLNSGALDHPYQNNYRLFVLFDESQHTSLSVSDWALAFFSIMSLGTLTPIPSHPTDLTASGILIDVSNDKTNFAITNDMTIEELLNSDDSRILGRFKIDSKVTAYNSIFLPSAWLAGPSQSYVHQLGVYEVIGGPGLLMWMKKATLINGLYDILRKLNAIRCSE